MAPPRYTLTEHTGDLAVRLWGDDLADLLRSGGLALFEVLTGDSPVRPVESRRVEARGSDPEELLIGWMNRLLLLFTVEGLLLCQFEPEPPAGGVVRGTARGEPFDPARHAIVREVKGVTYHDVRVERDGHRLTARVVLDV